MEAPFGDGHVFAFLPKPNDGSLSVVDRQL